MFAANESAKEKVIAAGVKVYEIDNTPFQKAVMPISEEFPQLKGLIDQVVNFEVN